MDGVTEGVAVRLLAVIAGALALLGGAATHGRALAAQASPPQPPIADPQELVGAYYQAFAAAVNSGDFGPLVAYFAPEAAIDSPLVIGGASGADQILSFFQKLPAMNGFTVEVSNVVEDDPYVDADWRFRASPNSLRGYLDGHDTFKIQDGLIVQLTQVVDKDAADQAFLPPPRAPIPTSAAVATDQVEIQSFKYRPAVIRVPAGATVTWSNADSDPHTVTTDDKSIDSGVIEQGVSVSLTFAVAGEYPYYCTIHPGMRGKLTVSSGQ